MGKVYKRKRRSCAMCKPHKTGHEPKRKQKERELCKVHEDEMNKDNIVVGFTILLGTVLVLWGFGVL